MMKITLLGYLKSSRLDKEGTKTLSFEFSAKDAVEVAKLELMGRDLEEHLPTLLKITVEGVNDKEEKKTRRGTASILQDGKRTPNKNTRVF